MGFRHIYIKKAELLSYQHGSLLIKKEDDVIEIPLEDIASILLEDPLAKITGVLLSELASYYIVLITCDKHYLPSSMTIPMNRHYREFKVFEKQLNIKKTVQSQIWSKIIAYKLENQIATLTICGCDDDRIMTMKIIKDDIKSGDKTNREAVGAKIFFTTLYGNTFVRNQNGSDGMNMALNYGYSIMASSLTRILAMYGFHTMIGIHHESKTNSYNLSYDFVEPFRAIVDLYVFKHRDDIYDPLSKEIRLGLIELLQESVVLNDKHYSVQNAMEELVKSYIRCLDEQDSSYLLLPYIEYDEPNRNNKL